MSAPTPAVRTSRIPGGRKLEDGYQTLILFATNPTIDLWEETVTPPGADGGAPVDITTMLNTKYRTKSSRKLIDIPDGKTTVGYDPAAYPQILALINVHTTITICFPDYSTICYFGYLQKFDPKEFKEGDMPKADATFVVTNVDPVSGAEAAPVYTAGSGTGTY